jgi:CubicO group peptidase (beta-lactamase class C family)
LIGEVIRRITGQTLNEFVATEIAGPLGADFQIGAHERDWDTATPDRSPESSRSSRVAAR